MYYLISMEIKFIKQLISCLNGFSNDNSIVKRFTYRHEICQAYETLLISIQTDRTLFIAF